MARQGFAIGWGTIALLIVAAAGVAWAMPDIVRYQRIKNM